MTFPDRVWNIRDIPQDEESQDRIAKLSRTTINTLGAWVEAHKDHLNELAGGDAEKARSLGSMLTDLAYSVSTREQEYAGDRRP